MPRPAPAWRDLPSVLQIVAGLLVWALPSPASADGPEGQPQAEAASCPAPSCKTQEGMPALTGMWEGSFTEIRGTKRTESPFHIEVSRQEGALLWAFDIWNPLDENGAVSREVRRDPLFGSLNPGGTGGVLVKQDACFTFRILDSNRIMVELVCIGQGEPSASIGMLLRAGSGGAPVEKPSFPDLTGSWRGPYRYPGPEGAIEKEFQLDVARQEAECLWVDDVWHPADPATGRPGAEVRKDPMIGGLGWDGRHGVLAKQDAHFNFRVLDENRLEVQFVRMGGSVQNPMAFYCILRRDGLEEALPGGEVPALAGCWEGPCSYAQPDGAKNGSARLEFMRQDGRLLWVDNVWHPLDPATGLPGTKTVREPLAGSLAPDGASGMLVKPGARFAFRLLSPGRMLVEFVRLRPGGQTPTAFYSVLTRVE